MGLQGRGTGPDWQENCVTFTNATPNYTDVTELSLARLLGGDEVNIPLDCLTNTFISGGTYSNGTLTLGRNDGVDITVDGFTFTGNTSGDCISDIYVSNIHSCSPVQFFDNQTPLLSIDSINGFTLVEGINMVIPDGSGINDSDGNTLLDGKSTTNTYNSNSSTGFATNYWENNLYESSISGTSTATTATTVFRTTQSILDGSQIFEINDINGGLIYKTGVGGGSGCKGAGCAGGGASDCSERFDYLFKCVDGCCIHKRSEYTEFGTSEGFSNIINEVVTIDNIYHNLQRLEDDTQKQFHTVLDFSTGEQLHRVSSDNWSGYIDNSYNYFDGDTLNLTQTISGTSTATTATTVFRTSYNIEDGIESKEIWDHTGVQLYQATVSATGGGCDDNSCTDDSECKSGSIWNEAKCTDGCCVASLSSSQTFFKEGSSDVFEGVYAGVDTLVSGQFLVDGTGTEFVTEQNFATGEQIHRVSSNDSNNHIDNGYNYFDGDTLNLTQTISGTSTATTATTVFRTSYNLIDGSLTESMFDSSGTKLYQATTNGGTGCGGEKTARSTPCKGQWKENPDNPGCCKAKDPSSDNVFSVSDEKLYGEDSNLDLIKEQYATTNGFGEWQGFAEGSGYNFNQIHNYSTGQIIDTIENLQNRLQKVVDVRGMGVNDLYSTSISGTSTATTATTVFRTSYNIEDGIETSTVDGIESLVLSVDGLSSTKVTTPAFNFQDGNQADGYVMTSDVNGNASWETPTGGGGSGDGNDYVTSGQYTTIPGEINTTFGGVSVNTTLISTDFPGYDTYRLSVNLVDPDYTNLYTIYGTSGCPLSIPPSYQEAAPFGANTGGANPAFFPIAAGAEFDGWLTVGITDGDTAGSLGSAGIDWESWTTGSGINTDNGAVFWMSPDDGPTGNNIVVTQISIPTGEEFTATMGLQGRTSGDSDYTECVTFTNVVPADIKALSLTRLSGETINIPTLEYTGNTSGNSITNLYVDNLNTISVPNGPGTLALTSQLPTGLSETLTFGGGLTGDVASLTYVDGILTARTLVP
jgi:hypothetical protein